MDIKIKVWLLDIQQAIEEIFLFLGEKRNFITYQEDLKTKKAVERNLEIIGEAVNRILKADSSLQIKNAKNIIGTRNRIIHSYDNISDEVIWTIVSRELPDLLEEVKSLIDRN
ncbi:MAG: antitoxin [Sphingobacteriaceae bacterium]|nr:antitoxin [Sphingobacteriaceae bacterium]